MTKEELFQVAETWTKELWQNRNIEAIDALHSPDFIDHSSAGRPGNNEGFMEGMMKLYNSFPDFFTKAEDFIIDTEKKQVAIRWTGKGTFKNNFLGFKPSGREVQFRGIEILTIDNGKVSDRWGEWDGFDIMEQLLQSSVENVIKKI